MAEVLYEKRGRVALMTLDRPEKLNALTPEGEELQGAYLEEFRDDDDAWVLIVTGSGRAFSTGVDLSQVGSMLGRKQRRPTLRGADAIEIWKPIIGAINGYAVGGGCELALACDVRIAAESARLGLPEVKRALIPAVGGIQRLIRAVPLGEAMKMLFTGDWVDAREALRIGLVQEVVPDAELLDRAFEFAELICRNGPIAVRTVKEAAYRGMDLPLRAALVQDQLLSLRNGQTEDAREGPKAFMEKREPNYMGR